MMPMSLAQTIEHLIRSARPKLSGRSLAEVLGVSPTMVSRWRNGESKPSVEQLYAIARYFGRPMEYFLNGNAGDEVTAPDDTVMSLSPDEVHILRLVRKLTPEVAESRLLNLPVPSRPMPGASWQEEEAADLRTAKAKRAAVKHPS